MGAADIVGASGEVISKVLFGVILGMLVYRTRGMLSGHVGIMAEAVVDPATYRGIFMHTIATLRSVGIEADDRIRGVLVTAYQSFVTNAGAIQPVKADLEKAAESAAKDAVAAVPIVPGAAAGAGGAGAALVGPVPGAQRIGPGLPLDAAAKLAASVEALRKRGREGAEAAPPAAKAARLADEDEEEEEAGASSADSSQDDDASGDFAVASPDSSQPPPGSQTSTEPDSPGNYGGRRCRSCGNVFGKTRRAARGKKSKKSGKTAKKGGKKAVRKGSFRKGRKHSKKQRR